MSDKLISADKLIRDLKGMLGEYDCITITGLIKSLDEAPAVDAVEVVRCKDCKWFEKPGCAILIVDDSDKPSKNDFCSFGERRDDNAVD